MLVSLVIPVFDAERSGFVRCLNSVLSQTFAELDVVVVDDGSSAEFAEWLDSFTQSDDRTRVIHQANAGVSGARNAGIAAARGTVVGFVDSDDYVMPDFVESALTALRTSNADIAFGGIAVNHDNATFHWRSGQTSSSEPVVLKAGELAVPRAGALASSPSPREDSPLISITNVVSALYKTELVRQVLFPTGVTQGEDRLFNFLVLKLAARVAFCSDIWYVYEQGVPGSATQSIGRDRGAQLVQTIRALADVGASAECRPPGQEAEGLRQAAAKGTFQYLKLMATVGAGSCGSSAVAAGFRAVLRLESVQEMLASAPVEGPADRLFRWLARGGHVRALLVLGRLHAHHRSMYR